MQGQVTVLVVSVDAEPTDLNNELTRLGVKVLFGALHDCEELIEEHEPDLIVLHGARGAMELASLIEGHDGPNPPRMVIAADRRELAKMIGLNRDVVVSLFATESGQTVLGQRIESLARRAARRRTASIPPISLKATALGLPSASRVPNKSMGVQLGKIELKGTASVLGKHPTTASAATPVREMEAPPPPVMEPSAEPVLEGGGSRTSSPGEAVEVADAELLSLRPSEYPEEDTQVVAVPPEARIGTLDPPTSSFDPPSLPPGAREVTQVQAGPSASEPPLSDFDVSGAEAALENLENLLVSASRPATPTNETPTNEEVSHRAQKDPVDDEADRQTEEAFFASEPAAPLEEEYVESRARPAKSESRGWSVWVPAALVAAAVGGGIYLNRGKPSGPVAKEVVQSPSQGTAETSLEVPSRPDGAAPEASAPTAVAAASAQPSSDASASASSDPSPIEPAPTEPEPTPSGTSQAPGAAEETDADSVLAPEPEPFLVKDTQQPSCEAVLAGDVPRAGRDIVHEASQLWGEARKLIVLGKVADAHKKMCQAVAINPESAAVEGLAGLYVDLFSIAEAEVWVKKAEAVRPGQREMALLMGDIQALRGDVQSARSTWLNALKIQEASTGQVRAMSRDYSTAAGRKLVTGDLVKAELWYRRAVVLDEQNLAALMGLANTFVRRDKPRHALVFAYKALSISDLLPEMQVLVGNIAAQVGKKEEARRRYEKALSVRSDFYPAKRGLSELN